MVADTTGRRGGGRAKRNQPEPDRNRGPIIGLAEPITKLPGVGPRTAEDLGKLGVKVQEDLLSVWPRKHIDRTVITPLAEVRAGSEYSVVGTVGTTQYEPRRQLLRVTVTDGLFVLFVTFFHGRWIANQLQPGTRVVLQGRVEYRGARLGMTHPSHQVLMGGEEPETGLIPVYPLAGDLKQRKIQQLMKDMIPRLAPQTLDPVPPALVQSENLVSRAEALLYIHHPPNRDILDRARRRLVFDEFLRISLAVLRLHQVDREYEGVSQDPEGPESRAFLARLPFKLTAGQQRAWENVKSHLIAKRPMSLLLQGDVGSGKTIIAVLAMLAAVDAGHQAAFMAPTELLAEQQWQVLRTWLEPAGIRVGLLTGHDPASANKIRRDLGAGTLQLVVGTQALVSPSVQFHRLGLVVIDEQHRFGVRQRAHLAQKGFFPDLLVMTATPIPRTLALTIYGDLEVSQIVGMPPGRQPITTLHLPYTRRREAYETVRQAVRRGEQAYVVCPLVHESDESDLTAAAELAEGMRQFSGWRVGLVHGQLAAREKMDVMEQYRQHQLDVLVATTIIEVGVDVPNATIMVIEEADRFGLAQLHQLRGRVGRGTKPATCFLLADPKTEDAQARMEAMVRWSDGLKLAEEDLKLRGPGQILGLQQHGLSGFELADPVADLTMLEHVREVARNLLERDPSLARAEHAMLRHWVDEALQQGEPGQVLH